MQVILVREAEGDSANGTADLLRYALSTSPVNDALLRGLHHLWRRHGTRDLAKWVRWARPADSLWVLPDAWRTESVSGLGRIVFHSDASCIRVRELEGRHRRPWMVVTNGRFATCINGRLLGQVLDTTDADVVAVTAATDLLAYQEKVRLTCDNELVGYRRLYADSVMPTPVEWPHHLFIRCDTFEAALRDSLSLGFETLIDRAKHLGIQGIAVAGAALDLETVDGMLALCSMGLDDSAAGDAAIASATTSRQSAPASRGAEPVQSRLIGPVLLGERVTIEAGAVVVGPSILCDGSTVGRDACVDSAIVGANATVEAGETIRNSVVSAGSPAGETRRTIAHAKNAPEMNVCSGRKGVFRVWPWLSYARCIKRILDVAAALIVLVLFAPVIPVIGLAIKISSSGPVFFRHRRQGRHGRSFDCIKFRTMKQGADKMQEKLRYICDVDGPQFKMADDPRITGVGRFLRETYLDEIPQFFNVLYGHMSVVGPRPSPEAENTLCPSWRDARLSVRPGITGLWQVCRTREPHKDFQEWIHYDTRYVRELSPGLDLWISWRTFRRMVEKFISQF